MNLQNESADAEINMF